MIHALPDAGTVLDDKLEVVGVLGTGGMGAVLAARNRRTGRMVAVKMLRPELVRDPDAVQRLLQEALACGLVQHPNVVDVYDAGVHDGAPYVVMELLRGESAATRLDRLGVFPIAEAVQVTLAAARGVAAAHAQGIVHRDLKPDNLFISAPPTGAGSEIVKVVDFGISKLSTGSRPLAETQTGLVLGTPHYMSPEQARGIKPIDGRTDVYSLGASLFHMCTGRVPYDGENYNSLMMAIVHDAVPDPRTARPGIPDEVAAIIERAMAKDRDARFATANELVVALEGLPANLVDGASSAPNARRFDPAIALAETGVAPTPFTSNVVSRPLESPRRKWPASIAAVAVLAVVAAVVASIASRRFSESRAIDAPAARSATRALRVAPRPHDAAPPAPTIAPTPVPQPDVARTQPHDAAFAANPTAGRADPASDPRDPSISTRPRRRAAPRPRAPRRDPDRGVL